jgi:hypothetical protein
MRFAGFEAVGDAAKIPLTQGNNLQEILTRPMESVRAPVGGNRDWRGAHVAHC